MFSPQKEPACSNWECSSDIVHLFEKQFFFIYCFYRQLSAGAFLIFQTLLPEYQELLQDRGYLFSMVYNTTDKGCILPQINEASQVFHCSVPLHNGLTMADLNTGAIKCISLIFHCIFIVCCNFKPMCLFAALDLNYYLSDFRVYQFDLPVMFSTCICNTNLTSIALYEQRLVETTVTLVIGLCHVAKHTWLGGWQGQVCPVTMKIPSLPQGSDSF